MAAQSPESPAATQQVLCIQGPRQLGTHGILKSLGRVQGAPGRGWGRPRPALWGPRATVKVVDVPQALVAGPGGRPWVHSGWRLDSHRLPLPPLASSLSCSRPAPARVSCGHPSSLSFLAPPPRVAGARGPLMNVGLGAWCACWGSCELSPSLWPESPWGSPPSTPRTHERNDRGRVRAGGSVREAIARGKWPLGQG